MHQILAKYAERSAPRYTSYPTAPHFQRDFPEPRYRHWLAGLDPVEPISLYLHVPFCKQMCWYCGCNMKLAARYAPLAAYAENLVAEIDLLAAALPARMRISHLHWGGGTPTALAPGDLAEIMARIGARFEFDQGAELAIESDPRTLTTDMIATIGGLGFTRVSFGVQEFDPQVQQAINRIQPPEMVSRATEALRAAGLKSVNFDLIYGLPYQTEAALAKTVATACEMAPDRVALFGYAHVPWMAKRQRMIATEALPGSDERARQASGAADALKAAGYEAIGIDHFARPSDALAIAARAGRLHRNFQGYTSDAARTLLGLGATAIGRTPFGYVQNITETGAWSREIGRGALPIARGHTLSIEDRLRAHVIERIMCDGAVELAAAGRAFGQGAEWWAAERAALAALAGDDLLVCDGGRLELTETGKPLARIVASVFDSYFEGSAVKHSAAL